MRLDQPNLVLVTVHDSLTGNDADITVCIDTGPHVAIEAAELASGLDLGEIKIDPGVPIPDKEVLRQSDARYEMTWDLRFSDETYNTMMIIVSDLTKACGAVTYDLTNQRFV
jgi:hypothetical protein